MFRTILKYPAKLGIAALATVAVTTPAPAQDLTEILEKRCAEGQAANDYPSWEFVANNAVRTADEYAMDRNPNATFVQADVEPVFQMAGEHAGEYLVKLLAQGSFGTSFAMMRPNFDFCADPAELDDSRADLFSVVSAKLNGKPF